MSLADAAAPLVAKYFRAGVSIDSKSDHTPVTIADRAIEACWRELITARYPDHGISGEEFGDSQLDAEWVWTLDPIDGTRAFASGKPVFGSLIALLHHGQPVLGIIDQPILHERWAAYGDSPATMNGAHCHTRPCASLSEAVLVFTSPHLLQADDRKREPFRLMDQACLTSSVGGDCYAYGLLASGYCDVIVEDNLDLHDFAALAPVVINAGGFMSDWRGQPLNQNSDGKVIAAGDQRVWHQAVTILQAFA
ncbi:MAG: histidinol phosphate phosphatase [Proteobacteria bacterium]|nr:histidinol phosphate phosphatase [Pseudomonadota bacterium]